MTEKLKHDSTATFKPIIYQFIIALDKCFELIEGESVFIEKYGDVTVTDSMQIEVKDYGEPLSDSHENLWKTLKNWLDESFDVSLYQSLILLTTQRFSKESTLINWNSKSTDGKRKVLLAINTKYQTRKAKSETTEKLFTYVLSKDNEAKLQEILDRFIILDSSLADDKLYEELKQKHAKVLSVNKDNFINSLLGYIISPQVTSSGWKITYKDFETKASSLAEEFSSTTVIFPKKYSSAKVSETDKLIFTDFPFVQKIKDIKYHEEVGSAITDFVNTRKTIAEELSQYKISKKNYDIYEGELHSSYSKKYKIASRNSKPETLNDDSQNFYDTVTDYPVQNFRNFNDTPLFFRNGLLHEMANSENSEKDIIWKLKVKDE